MSEENYRKATELVKRGYETETDKQGRSQRWKLDVIKEDSRAGKMTTVLRSFIDSIEEIVDRMETIQQIVQTTSIPEQTISHEKPEIEVVDTIKPVAQSTNGLDKI